MRTRPELELYLFPSAPVAGSRMRAEAVLESHSETPIEGVEFHLEGVERRHTGTAVVGKVPVARYATAVHVDLFGRTPAMTLSEGKHTFVMNFDVPRTAPPEYRSSITTIEYALTVRVVIPWWPDRVGRYTIPLVALPRVTASKPVSFCTDSRGQRGDALYIEASIDRTAIAPGEVVTGAASIGNVEHHRVRRIELSLVAMERVAGTKDAGDEVQRYTMVIHDGPPADSQPIPFRVRFPENATPSFRGVLAELHWHAEVRAVVSLGADISLSIPLDVVCRPEGAPAPPAASRVAPVGRERRAMVWEAVARRHGFDNDAEEERMRRGLGAGALEITLEPRREGGLATVARLRFPGMGIGLSVTEKRWTDAITRRGFPSGHEGFDERFTARGREEAQVRAFLDQKACEALLLFERASVDDGGATFESPCAAQSVEELDGVIRGALTAARTLLDASQRIPPPAAMALCVAEWQELAALLNGRLQVGCMAIRGAVFDHQALEIVTEWSEDADPARTVIRLFLRDVTEAERDRPVVLQAPADEIAAALSSSVRELEVTRGCVEASVPAPLTEPRALLPTLEGLARLVRAVEGKGSPGPYR